MNAIIWYSDVRDLWFVTPKAISMGLFEVKVLKQKEENIALPNENIMKTIFTMQLQLKRI